MTRFMIAVDGSDHSEKAYQIASKIIKPEDEIIFISITAPVKEKSELGQSAKAKAKESAKELLDTWDKRAKDDGHNSSTLLVEAADPRDAICGEVDKQNVDILVLGTRGLGTLKRMFLGSVSNYCVQNANCDVIVAK